MSLHLPSQLFVGGEFRAPAHGGTEVVLNPATEEPIGEAPLGTRADAEAAVAAARESFDRGAWRRLAPRDRAEAMRRVYEHLAAREDEIVELITAEAGALAGMARAAQFGAPMKHFRYFLEAAARPMTTMAPPELTLSKQGDRMLGTAIVEREPVGVVTAITAFNYPMMLNVMKVVPALLMGNSVILKPSPYTPFVALLLAEAVQAAGLPEGVFNVVTGGKDAGELLTADPRVDMVTFTGSDEVGAAIAAQAAPTLKRVVMELGGKSALIVRDDADLESAVAVGSSAILSHSGQACVALSRQLVHRSLLDRYLEGLVRRVEGVRIGDPRDPQSQMGPLIRAAQRERVESFVAGGLKSGGRLVTGGRRPEDLPRGYYFQPTVFADVDNSWPLAQQEIFGPVVAVMGFDSDEEAIRIANDSPYGLNAHVFSADVGAALDVARELQSGNVSLNGGSGAMLSAAPFGGVKRSGYGREAGVEGLLEFTAAKTISFHAA